MKHSFTQSETHINSIKELSELVSEGFFGEDVLHLTLLEEKLSTSEYLYEILNDWSLNDNQFRKNEVKELIIIFLGLYSTALKIDSGKTIDCLTTFFYGTKDNPHLENMSAYVDFAISYKNTINMINEIDLNKLSDKKKYGNAIANTYSKGVEFIGKTFVTCIIMNFIINNQNFNFMKIYNLTLHDKSQLLNEVSNDKTKILIKFINRNLRNSEAHLSLTFNPINNIYTYKKLSKSKTKLVHIPGEQMVTEYLIGVGLYGQAFIYSGILFTLALIDKDKFQKCIKNIYDLKL